MANEKRRLGIIAGEWIENESNDRDDFFRKFQETTEIIYPITQFIIIDPLNDSIMYSDKVSKGLEKLNGYFYHIGQNELIQPHCTIKSIEPEMHIDAAVKRIIDLMMKAIIPVNYSKSTSRCIILLEATLEY